MRRVFALALYLLSSRVFAETPVTSQLGCPSFKEWVEHTKSRGTWEIPVIKDRGYNPNKKWSYEFVIFGSAKDGEVTFRVESRVKSAKIGLAREFSREGVRWLDDPKLIHRIPSQKKVLVWAGARGPADLKKWVDMFRGKDSADWNVVDYGESALSEQGTIYFFPEGILEIFARKPPSRAEPTLGPSALKRTYLWSGGCVEDRYPSPWPERPRTL